MWSRRGVKTPGRGGLGLPYMARASLRGAPPAKAGQKCPLWPAGGMKLAQSILLFKRPGLTEWEKGRRPAPVRPPEQGDGPESTGEGCGPGAPAPVKAEA